MNIQMRYYSYRTTGYLFLSNCNCGYIKICNNNIIGMKSAYLYFESVSLIFSGFNNNHEKANMRI